MPIRTMLEGSTLAAVDLGSNSFRLEISRYEHGQLRRLEYLKETVRQGNGIDPATQELSAEAMERGWQCLARFSERLSALPGARVRAVATQTLRDARNRSIFIDRGSRILGHPIEVISGAEEARLIYQGVSRLLPPSDERRLVVDIGGRSTELILGQRHEALDLVSCRVGSVAWSMQYFPQGQLTARAFEQAEVAACAVLEAHAQRFDAGHWDQVYGSSGTAGAVGEILAQLGSPAGLITQEGLDLLLERLLKAQSADRLRVEGLKDDRRPVIGGGISVLRAVFRTLGIREMRVAQGALRQGALYDLIAQETPDTDPREASVRALQVRFDVEQAQAQRVLKTAQQLWQAWSNKAAGDPVLAQSLLGWAAALHEIGACVARSAYHKHGAYILDHADTAGFTPHLQHALSLLVLGHRGKLRKIEVDPGVLDERISVTTWTGLLLCLRLAVALCHARQDPVLEGMELKVRGTQVQLRLHNTWCKAYPQSAHLLQEEVHHWQGTSLPCQFSVQLRGD